MDNGAADADRLAAVAGGIPDYSDARVPYIELRIRISSGNSGVAVKEYACRGVGKHLAMLPGGICLRHEVIVVVIAIVDGQQRLPSQADVQRQPLGYTDTVLRIQLENVLTDCPRRGRVLLPRAQ